MAHDAISISDDEKWQVEQDVRTLKEAELIKKDDNRLAKAMDAAMEGATKARFQNTNFPS